METVVLEKTDTKVTFKKNKRVVMHNDDTTSFECVIEILKQIFNKTEDEALTLTMAIHMAGPNGSKVVAEYASRSVAEGKASKAMKFAKSEGYSNFKVTVID